MADRVLQVFRTKRQFVLGAVLAFAAVAAAGATRAQVPTQALIVGAIDESHTVTLVGNTRPEATAANDRGAVPDSLPLDISYCNCGGRQSARRRSKAISRI
jgi:hypothetical protein